MMSVSFISETPSRLSGEDCGYGKLWEKLSATANVNQPTSKAMLTINSSIRLKKTTVRTGLPLACLGLVLPLAAIVGPLAPTANASVWTLSGDLNSHDPCIYK
jgi:hypothetical protein